MRKSSKAFKRADEAQQAMLAAVSIYKQPQTMISVLSRKQLVQQDDAQRDCF